MNGKLTGGYGKWNDIFSSTWNKRSVREAVQFLRGSKRCYKQNEHHLLFFFFLIEFIFCLSNLAEIGGINLSRKKKYQEKL